MCVPCSGLDAYHALSLVRVLADLCRESGGRVAVVASVHCPSSEAFLTFDCALLLSAGGRTLWAGPTRDAEADDGRLDALFSGSGCACPPGRSRVEHALFYAIEEAGASGAEDKSADEEAEAAADAAEGAAADADLRAAARGARLRLAHARALLRRELLRHAREPALAVAHSALALLLAAWLGVVYHHLGRDVAGFQDRLGVAFFTLLSFGFGALSAASSTAAERPLLRKEAHRYYHPALYVAAKAAVDLVLLRALPAALYTAVLYRPVGLQPARWRVFYAAVSLSSLACAAMAMFLGAACRSPGLASLVISFVLLQWTVFGGLLTASSQLPPSLAWLRFTSVFWYAFETLIANEFHGEGVR